MNATLVIMIDENISLCIMLIIENGCTNFVGPRPVLAGALNLIRDLAWWSKG